MSLSDAPLLAGDLEMLDKSAEAVANVSMPLARFTRRPCALLQPWVHTFWALDESIETPGIGRCEHVLPTGQMHLVIRLGADPLRIFSGPDDRIGWTAGSALVGGARESFYARAMCGPQRSVGAQLRPGAAEALLGVPADELAGRHTPLEDVWGTAAGSVGHSLAELPSLEVRVDAFERMLLSRLPRARAMHPAVAHALSRFSPSADVGRVLAATGYSHRTMITLFRRSVGLAPKQYARVLRFASAVRHLRSGERLADVALMAGYSDQAHFSREFRVFAGATPSDYRRIAPPAAHHLPVRDLPESSG